MLGVAIVRKGNDYVIVGEIISWITIRCCFQSRIRMLRKLIPIPTATIEVLA